MATANARARLRQAAAPGCRHRHRSSFEVRRHIAGRDRIVKLAGPALLIAAGPAQGAHQISKEGAASSLPPTAKSFGDGHAGPHNACRSGRALKGSIHLRREPANRAACAHHDRSADMSRVQSRPKLSRVSRPREAKPPPCLPQPSKETVCWG
jgi:hypothetical protein